MLTRACRVQSLKGVSGEVVILEEAAVRLSQLDSLLSAIDDPFIALVSVVLLAVLRPRWGRPLQAHALRAFADSLVRLAGLVNEVVVPLLRCGGSPVTRRHFRSHNGSVPVRSMQSSVLLCISTLLDGANQCAPDRPYRPDRAAPTRRIVRATSQLLQDDRAYQRRREQGLPKHSHHTCLW